ncbi:MAG: aminotransferase class IV, partial [Candidatus Diapherotrites archaeon]|nr:aminotransferase class IV [Candidatus Diapherotrites archaeon]
TILEGTTKKIIEALAAKTMDVREEKIKKENLGQYDEFFMTSTVFGIMPLSNIDGKTFRIGEKTKKLAKAFNEYCKNYFNSQA